MCMSLHPNVESWRWELQAGLELAGRPSPGWPRQCWQSCHGTRLWRCFRWGLFFLCVKKSWKVIWLCDHDGICLNVFLWKLRGLFLFFVGQEHENLVYQHCWLRLLWFSHFTFYFMFIGFGFCLFLFPLFTLMALGDLMDVPQLCPLVLPFTYLPEITTSIGKSSRNGPISIALFS